MASHLFRAPLALIFTLTLGCGIASPEYDAMLETAKAETLPTTLQLDPLTSTAIPVLCSSEMGCTFEAQICITPQGPLEKQWLLATRFSRDAFSDLSRRSLRLIFWDQNPSNTQCKQFSADLWEDLKSDNKAYLQLGWNAEVPVKVELKQVIIADKQSCFSGGDEGDDDASRPITIYSKHAPSFFSDEPIDFKKDFRPGDKGDSWVYLHDAEDVDYYRVIVQPTKSAPLLTAKLNDGPFVDIEPPAGALPPASEREYLVEMTYSCNDGRQAELTCLAGEQLDARTCGSIERITAIPDCTDGGQALLRLSSQTWIPLCTSLRLEIAVD